MHIEAMTKEEVEACGYQNVRQLEDGTWAGTVELIFTRAICTGISPLSWAYRWCFEDKNRALIELAKLTSMDDTPTGWVARR